ncbi:DUF1822 family protein [Floridanema aerugineum]|uniref:DUF1822 family protein n=1 Tax=Floridaenema aerugineum BLCC-F46 TaxID=3153654 RepID=A0ABV4WXM1_9CYAN
MSRSARVHKDYIQKVKFCLRRNGYIRQIDLAENLNLSQSTISNFLNGKPIDYLNFLEICAALSLEWKEIVDLETQDENSYSPINLQSEPEQTSQARSKLFIELKGSIEEVDKPLVDALIALLQERSEDMSLTLQRIKTGSVVLILEGSQKGCERIEAMFREGQLAELLGIDVLSARVEPIPDLSPNEILEQLRQELENLFKVNWQPAELILARSGIRSNEINANAVENSVRRAKEINLGGEQAAVLAVQMIPESEYEIGICVSVYPSSNAIHLPRGLQIIVLDEFGTPISDLQEQAGSAADSIKIEFEVEPGERFGVRVALGNVSITEDF